MLWIATGCCWPTWTSRTRRRNRRPSFSSPAANAPVATNRCIEARRKHVSFFCAPFQELCWRIYSLLTLLALRSSFFDEQYVNNLPTMGWWSVNTMPPAPRSEEIHFLRHCKIDDQLFFYVANRNGAQLFCIFSCIIYSGEATFLQREMSSHRIESCLIIQALMIDRGWTICTLPA